MDNFHLEVLISSREEFLGAKGEGFSIFVAGGSAPEDNPSEARAFDRVKAEENIMAQDRF